MKLTKLFLSLFVLGCVGFGFIVQPETKDMWLLPVVVLSMSWPFGIGAVVIDTIIEAFKRR